MSAGAMRIHRALARAGVASRRAAETLVAEGRVRVNGEVARTGQSVDPARDTITVDGTRVGRAPRQHVWHVLHKPRGVLTSRAAERGRQTVFDLVPDAPGLVYVGRLDYLTEGLLLLTTDGDAAHRLTHPSREVPRTYRVTVHGDVERAAQRARGGVALEDGSVRATDVKAIQGRDHQHVLELTLTEGRTREVRRLCAAIDLQVIRLQRTRFGPVQLGALPEGAHRPLTPRERSALDALIKAP